MQNELTKEINAFNKVLEHLFVRSSIYDAYDAFLQKRQVHPQFNFIVRYDYLQLQLLDLRKFFVENDKDSYTMPSLLAKIDSKEANEKYEELKIIWSKEFKKLANKLLFHLDKNYVPAMDNVDRGKIESLMDQLRDLMNFIIKTILTQNASFEYKIVDLDRNGSELMELKAMTLESLRNNKTV